MKKLVILAGICATSLGAVAEMNGDSLLKVLEEVAIIDQKVMMPMRDGVRLCTDIYRPKGDGPFPIIFSKTPYNFNTYGDGKIRTRHLMVITDAVRRGYAYVIQNERGRYFSEGDWEILGAPTTDGYDAFEWMANQPWSNGKIGSIGCSSTAEWQMAVASLDHPAHTAMVPMGYGAGIGRVGRFWEQGNLFRGGAVQMLFIAWLYHVQHDKMRPRIPKDATQEDLLRLQTFYDLEPEQQKVDWSEALWHLPVTDIIDNVNGPKEIYDSLIVRKPNSPQWYKGGLYHDDMPFPKPSYWFCSWYDVSIGPNIELFNHVRNRAPKEVADNQYLLIGPTTHCGFYRGNNDSLVVGERYVGDASMAVFKSTYRWFDYWLKGEQNNVLKDLPRIKYYTMGSNEWKTAQQWPPKGSKLVPYYLHSGGKANTRNGDGALTTQPAETPGKDGFVYDPMDPVPSHGGNVCCTGNAIKGGAFDQQENELREDVLVYTTPPLDKGVEVTGFIEATLYVESDAKDTDFTLKLIDVYPDGRAYNLDETIMRCRYREGYNKEVMMEKGKVYKLEMSPLCTSNYFKKGHQIRIEISSSNFPRFTRNLNTGGNNVTESKGVVANNVIHHGPDTPSQVRLPVVK